MMYPKIEQYGTVFLLSIHTNTERRTKKLFQFFRCFCRKDNNKKGAKGGKNEKDDDGKEFDPFPLFFGKMCTNTPLNTFTYPTVSRNTNLDVVFLQMYPLRPLIDPWFWAQTRGQSICLGHLLEKCTIIQLQLTRFSSSEYCKILLDQEGSDHFCQIFICPNTLPQGRDTLSN